jgi:hypothetical protein
MSRILLLPSVFGISHSEHIRQRELAQLGHQARIIDLYNGQDFVQPGFLGFMIRNRGSNSAIDRLALSIREEPVFASIQRQIQAVGEPVVLF